jgi:molybdopterin-guanine dinucleotide biosynthesis protein A
MGRDKALLPFRGGVLGAFVAAVVAEAAGSVILVGRPEAAGKLGYPAIPDLYPGEGPLGGIVTALNHTSEDWNLLTACDMPGLSTVLLRRLLDAAELRDADVLIPLGPSGLPEPLCAVYHRRARGAIQTAFDRGVRRVTDALGEIRTVTLPVPEVAQFQNVNTPEDWAGYAAE